MRQGRTLEDLAVELDRQNEAKVDFLSPAKDMQVGFSEPDGRSIIEQLLDDEEEKRKEVEQKKEIDAYKKRKAESDAHPTNSSTKTEIKAYLDKNKIEYEDAAKEELFKLVPEKEEFTEVEPAAYSKKAKPDWIK